MENTENKEVAAKELMRIPADFATDYFHKVGTSNIRNLRCILIYFPTHPDFGTKEFAEGVISGKPVFDPAFAAGVKMAFSTHGNLGSYWDIPGRAKAIKFFKHNKDTSVQYMTFVQEFWLERLAEYLGANLNEIAEEYQCQRNSDTNYTRHLLTYVDNMIDHLS
jgi:hypothetical protein